MKRQTVLAFLLSCAFLLVSFNEDANGSPSSSFLGMTTHITRAVQWDNEFMLRNDIIQKLKDININFIHTDFLWRRIQPERGRFDWRVPDEVVRLCKKHGFQILGVLHSPPKWASPAHKHINEWKTFVARVVSRYGDDIKHWEIWNEPNVKRFWPQNVPASKFVPIVKEAYSTIKKIRPDAKIILAGLGDNKRAFPFWEVLFQKGVLDYCDGIAFHPYLAGDVKLLSYVRRLRDLLKKFSHPEKPLWITEFGVSARQYPFHPERSDIISKVIKASIEKMSDNRKNEIRLLVGRHQPVKDPYLDLNIFRPQLKKWDLPLTELKEKEIDTFLEKKPAVSVRKVIITSGYVFAEHLNLQLIDFIKNGGFLIIINGLPNSRNRGFKINRNYLQQLGVDLAYVGGEDKYTEVIADLAIDSNMGRSGLKGPIFNVIKPPKSGDLFYTSYLKAYRNGRYIGDVCGLYEFKRFNGGALLVFPIQLGSGQSYVYQANHLIKTALAFWALNGSYFFAFEFKDPYFHTQNKYFGVNEHDLFPKPAMKALAWLSGIVTHFRCKRFLTFHDGMFIELDDTNGKTKNFITWGKTGANRMKALRGFSSKEIIIESFKNPEKIWSKNFRQIDYDDVMLWKLKEP